MTTIELNYESAGEETSPPLVMGGSLGSTLAMWDPQVAELSGRLRPVRIDHRGHGGSPVPPAPYTIDELGGDVVALLDRLGLERASYCGLSLGGMVGMWLGINAPERIDRLVLISTSAYMGPSSQWEERASLVRAAGSAAAVADAVVARWFTPDYAERHPDVVARHRAMIAGSPPEGYAACCEAIAPMDLREDLSRIEAPTLVISAAEDPSTPPEMLRAIAASIPAARLEVVPDAAHLVNVQQAETVNALIAEHLGAAG